MDAKFIDKKTSITLKGSTKDILADIGSKGDSYEDTTVRRRLSGDHANP